MTVPLRAAIYARISLDRTGAGLGVERQIEDCEALIVRSGWNLIDTYVDNDVSAFSGKLRPAYRQLLADMDADRFDRVVAWHTDRLHRNPSELETYIDVSERGRISTVTVQAGALDLATASGRMIARMLGAAARAESEQKAERVSRARQQAAESGRANGLLGFGYRSDQSIDPGQAATVLEISSRILAGETLYRIASDLNGRGVRAPGGGEWRSANLRQMVTRASLSGWREWSAGKRTASRGDRRTGNRWGEFTALGIWDPILSRETVEQLRELFANPGRRVVGRPVYALLTGVARCGKCGAPMTSAPGTVGRRYRCNSQPGMTRCGGVSILSEPVDILVTEALLDRLSLSRIPEKVNRGPQGAREPLLSELEQAKRKRDDIATLYATDQLTQSEWVSARRAVTIRIEEAEHALRSAGISPNPALKNLPEGGPKLRGWWAAADTQQRSAVVKAVIERVDIAPGRPGANRFDPARVGYPVWRS